jgi:hypothetical protein
MISMIRFWTLPLTILKFPICFVSHYQTKVMRRQDLNIICTPCLTPASFALLADGKWDTSWSDFQRQPVGSQAGDSGFSVILSTGWSCFILCVMKTIIKKISNMTDSIDLISFSPCLECLGSWGTKHVAVVHCSTGRPQSNCTAGE